MGKCLEELGKRSEAISTYERVSEVGNGGEGELDVVTSHCVHALRLGTSSARTELLMYDLTVDRC